MFDNIFYSNAVNKHRRAGSLNASAGDHPMLNWNRGMSWGYEVSIFSFLIRANAAGRRIRNK